VASKYECFEGQVVFYTTYQSLECFIVRDAVDAALPDMADESRQRFTQNGTADPARAQIVTIYRNFRQFLGDTSRIEFHLSKESDSDLLDFRDWWKSAQNNADYAALWVTFRRVVTWDVQSAWIQALENAVPQRLMAPVDLQPGAPEDAELEAINPNV